MMRKGYEQQAKLLNELGVFDANWYRDTYPDVMMTRMEPALHYVKYGFRMDREPGPDFPAAFYKAVFDELNHTDDAVAVLKRLQNAAQEVNSPMYERVLLAAYRDFLAGNYDRSIALSEKYMRPEYSYTVNILKANVSLARQNENEWCAYLNNYLDHFGMSPVCLKTDGDTILHRLTITDLVKVSGGPLISIIMPAWNAQDTIEMAVSSVLAQTWQNIELIVVDDCSEDDTWSILKKLSALDSRLKIRRNVKNVGPYVSKNLALSMVTGEWITGHDADDWAHPQRIEHHVKQVLSEPTPVYASHTYMIRVNTEGYFTTINYVNPFSPDGVTRVSSIATLFDAKFLREKLGFWDCVRYGADTEMISRAEHILGGTLKAYNQIGMICLTTGSNLTSHPQYGVRTKDGGLSSVRQNYKRSWFELHEQLTPDNLYLPFPQKTRPYKGNFNHVVLEQDILDNIA